MAPSLAVLKNKRAITKGACTRINSFLESNDSFLVEELECRLSLLEAYFKQLVAIQDQIDNCEDANDADKAQIGDIEEMYCTVKAKLLSLISKYKVKESPSQLPSPNVSFQEVSGGTAHHSPSLPRIKLPQFSGNYVDYLNFINAFKQAVSEDRYLSKLQKFLHLKSCLTGEALQTVAALEVTADNYEEALKLLETRYDNPYIIFDSHVSTIFDIPPASKESPSQLRTLVDTVNVHLTAMKALGSSEDILNLILLHIVRKKIDRTTNMKWEESRDHSKIPTWCDFAKFINNRCQCLCSRSSMGGLEPPNPPHKQSSRRRAVLTVNSQHCAKCCKNDHAISKCPEILAMSIMDRFAEIKMLGLCINCLRKGHTVRNCRSSKCRVCSQPHHSILHRYVSHSSSCEPASARINANLVAENSQVNSSSLHSSSTHAPTNQVILATAVVYIKDGCGQLVPVRALLDSASQLNFVTESLSQILHLRRHRVDVEINGIGQLPSRVKFSSHIGIKSRASDFSTDLEALVLPQITSLQPETRINPTHWEIPHHIQLADPKFFLPQKIDLLLGADIFYKVLSSGP